MAGARVWPEDAQLAMSFVVNVEEGAGQKHRGVAAGTRQSPSTSSASRSRVPIRNYANETELSLRHHRPARLASCRGCSTQHRIQCDLHGRRGRPREGTGSRTRRRWAAGHEVCSHGHRWVHQFSFDEKSANAASSGRRPRALAATTGTRPFGWLSRYLFTEPTRDASSSRKDTSITWTTSAMTCPDWDLVNILGDTRRGIVIVPYAIDTNDMKMWVAPAYTPAAVARLRGRQFRPALPRKARPQPKIMSLGVHLRIIGRPGRIGALAKFMQHVAARSPAGVDRHAPADRRALGGRESAASRGRPVTTARPELARAARCAVRSGRRPSRRWPGRAGTPGRRVAPKRRFAS